MEKPAEAAGVSQVRMGEKRAAGGEGTQGCQRKSLGQAQAVAGWGWRQRKGRNCSCFLLTPQLRLGNTGTRSFGLVQTSSCSRVHPKQQLFGTEQSHQGLFIHRAVAHAPNHVPRVPWDTPQKPPAPTLAAHSHAANQEPKHHRICTSVLFPSHLALAKPNLVCLVGM